MVDYSQFEASVKSGIHADVSRIRQKDEIIKAVVKKRRNSAITCVCLLCMAGISLFKSWIPAVICFLLALFFLWRAVGKFSDEYLREMYEEGLLVPGMIVKTEPLTITLISVMSVTHFASGSSDLKSRFNRSSDFWASRSAFVIPFGLRLG